MNAILIREGKNRGPYKNIGDFTQSIAQRQYWGDKIDKLVDIEELSDVESEVPVNVVMNGWFMWYPEKFPPAPCINPLFVSFHLSPSFERDFFKEKTIKYLKAHEPIGTRDTKTKELMEKYGIKSYFSGCLTLTLDKTYLEEKHGDDIYIVDPVIHYSYRKTLLGKCLSLLSLSVYLVNNFTKIKLLSKKFLHQKRTPIAKISKSIDELLETAAFYRTYSKCFADDIIFNAEYISQIVDNYVSVEEKFCMADERLKKYAKAKLVITRRIHAALPCLALKTPVILTINDDIIANTPQIASDGGRFGGILELFNYKKFSKNGIVTEGCDPYISMDNIPQNPERYLYYRDLLDKKVSDFVKVKK